jgi:hypothetical protein
MGTSMLAVREFITKLEQGYTEAFLCRAEDGHRYVTKSGRAGRESLIREYLCGQIGRRMNLPIPPFEVLYATESIARFSVAGELKDLVSMPGFGSRFVTGPESEYPVSLPALNVADVADVPAEIRRAVLLFDWWVLNIDRIDGNTNLLWEPRTHELHVIDHNLAFTESTPPAFWEHHLFRKDRHRLSDPAFRALALPPMQSIISELPRMWTGLPDEWTDSCILTEHRVDQVLRRCKSDDFWCAQ